VTRLLTLGHGTAAAGELVALLKGAGVARLVDVRTSTTGRSHRPTDGVRRDGDLLAYDLGSTPPLPEG
jgi:hypothetical protein